MKAKSLLVSTCLAISVLLTSCFGTFKLTTSVYDWNMSLGNDVAKELVFLVCSPVYGICVFLDVFFLNTIEYWTGGNPMSMEEGEEDTRLICHKGDTYTVTARKHEFEVTNCENVTVHLKYHENEDEWYVYHNGEKMKYPKRKISKFLASKY